MNRILIPAHCSICKNSTFKFHKSDRVICRSCESFLSGLSDRKYKELLKRIKNAH